MSKKLEYQLENEEFENAEQEVEEISTEEESALEEPSEPIENTDSEDNQEVSLIDRLRNNELPQLKSELETVVAKKIANRIADYKEKVKSELQK